MSFRRIVPIMLLQILLLSSFTITPSSASKNVQVTDEVLRGLCMKTSDYYFCKTTYRMWDGIEHANKYEVANVGILSATIQARLNKYLVKLYIQSGRFPSVKAELEQCYGDFIVTAGKLEAAYTYSDHKECDKSKTMLKDALRSARTCDTSFERLDDDIANPIDMYSFDLLTRCYIALVAMNEVC